MEPMVAGVDSSTQSCTIELRAADTGRLLGTGRAPHPPTYPPTSEQHPDAWWDAFVAALDAACRDAGRDAKDIAALSVGAQCHGLVTLDGNDVPLRPAKLWNDTTSAPDTQRLIAERSQQSWVEQVGVPMNPALTITKLAWLVRNEPDTFAQIRRICLPHDYLTFRLTGEHVTDRSDASGTGYYDAPANRHRTDLLAEHVSDQLPWDELLPRVLGPQERAGTISAEAAAATGLPTSCVVGPGGGDQHLAAAGIGLRVGETAFSLGTSGVVFATTPDAVKDPRVDGVCDTTGGYLPLLCTLNCAKVTDYFAKLLGVDVATLGEMALTVTDTELTMVPYLDGERSPMRPDASGVIAGLRTGTSREEVAFAAFDGVVSGLVWAYQVLDDLLPHSVDGRVLAIGGGARSRAYRQLLADRTGRPVLTVDAPEATARGACVQAAAVLAGETVETMRDAWAPPTVTETDPRVDRQGLPESYVTLRDAADAMWGYEPANTPLSSPSASTAPTAPTAPSAASAPTAPATAPASTTTVGTAPDIKE